MAGCVIIITIRVRLNNIIKVASEPITAARILKAALSTGGPAVNRDFSLPNCRLKVRRHESTYGWLLVTAPWASGQ